MKIIIIKFLFLILFIGVHYGCSASGSGDRYSENKLKDTKTADEESLIIDISKDITVPSYYNPSGNSNKEESLWGTFTDDSSAMGKIIRVPGYRIQALTTDDFDEADSLKLVLYQQLRTHSIYIIFDPPYYKLRVGDFSDINSANDLQFRMRQIGYRNTSITPDTVSVRTK